MPRVLARDPPAVAGRYTARRMERERRPGASTETEPGPDADALTLRQGGGVRGGGGRAPKLDAGQRSPAASGLVPEEVARIALEAGLSAGAVDAALRELELGKLGEEQKQLDLLDE